MIKRTSVWAVTLLMIFTAWQAQAQTIDSTDSAYYTLHDSSSKSSSFQNPLDTLQEGIQAFTYSTTWISLMNWLRHDGPEPAPTEAYNRKKHFGTWINDPNDGTCFNTRAKVLIRDSVDPVKFKATNHCVVESGRWEDPYTGREIRDAREIQIDHVVPLKNAYQSGAWTWTTKKRCLYANFMANRYHLLSVDGIQNMSKGDSAPDQYMPPSTQYTCQYLQEWLKIKLIWNLEMTASEAHFIKDVVDRQACDLKFLTISSGELRKQRAATESMQEICGNMASRIDQKIIRERQKEASSQAGETL